ncbi:probable arginine--tRNA ligase, mitochondrial isoform X2 [Hoplias malabaricus]|uniref:probable arginine--tRNA ligase, mitochondrial isoform X2 n=1 Tax=Hoplias malabaricus TaxID=27720 RepID=UPI003461914F
MACFFRRRAAAQLSRVCGAHEDVFIPLLSAAPVSKKQLTPVLRLSVNSLVKKGVLPPDADLQTQTQRLAKQLKEDGVVEEVIPGRGVIHFRINRLLLAQKLLEQLHSDPEGFGRNSELLGKAGGRRTLVEFSSPNIAKKFHAGHLRSTIIGLLGAGFQRLGSQEKLRENPLQHLYEVYVQVNREAELDEGVRLAAAEFFRRLEQGDGEALKLWRHFREITVDEYRTIYERLGVYFDHFSGESFHQSKTQEVLQELRSRGLLRTTEEGTEVVDLSTSGNQSSFATLVRSDGTSLYITRDIAAALERRETFGFDEMIYVTDKSQSHHFQQLFQILKAMGHHWADRCVHVTFGLVLGMSSRLGNVVLLEDVLNEARRRMLHNMKEAKTSKELTDPELTAEQIGVSALIIQDFKGPLIADYKFDWEKVLQSQGDTGVFLQYTHARLCSLLRSQGGGDQTVFDASHLLDDRSISILQHLLRFDEVLLQSASDLQPRHLVNFLLTLSHLAASALRELQVKGSDEGVAQARLRLFSGTRSVLGSGMRILGIRPVERM